MERKLTLKIKGFSNDCLAKVFSKGKKNEIDFIYLKRRDDREPKKFARRLKAVKTANDLAR